MPRGIDALRVPWQQLKRLHELLDRRAADAPGQDRREAPRAAYHRSAHVVVTLVPPGRLGSDRFAQRFVVVSRDLSAGGMGFLHGAYVNISTCAKAELETLEGKWVALAGKVVRCRHISGKLHEVGVAFDEPIDPQRYVTFEHVQKAESAPALPRLAGRVLAVTSSADDRGIMRDVCRAVGVDLTVLSSAAEAVEMVKAGVPCDAVILAVDSDAASAADTMRRAEWTGPIVLLTRDTDHAIPESVSVRMVWPIDAEGIHDTLSQYLRLADRS